MLRPIPADGTCRYSTGRPGRENAPAVAAPPARPIRPGRVTAAAAPTKSRRPQARIFSLTSVIPAPLVVRSWWFSAGIYRVNTPNVDWDAKSSQCCIGFCRQFRYLDNARPRRQRAAAVARRAEKARQAPGERGAYGIGAKTS